MRRRDGYSGETISAPTIDEALEALERRRRIATAARVFLGFMGLLMLLSLCYAAIAVASRGAAQQIREQLIAELEMRTGRRFTAGAAGGNPIMGFYVRDVRMRETPRGGATAGAAKIVRITVSPLGLFSKNPSRFSSIEIEQPSVYIERTPDGRLNVGDVFTLLLSGDGSSSLPPAKFAPREIKVSDGAVSIRLWRKGLKRAEIAVKHFNGTLSPRRADGATAVSFSAAADNMDVSGKGFIRCGKSGCALDLKWNTSRVRLSDLPDFLMIGSNLRVALKAAGTVRMGGTVAGAPLAPAVEAEAVFKNVVALDHYFGRGYFKAKSAGGVLDFTGELGPGDAHLEMAGRVRYDNYEATDIEARFSGFDIDAVAGRLMPERPSIIKGIAAGKMKISGPGYDPRKMKFTADLTVKDGELEYPTPSFGGQRDLTAPLRFKTMRARVVHIRPEVDIRDAVLTGPGLFATGAASFR
ncbi:MAG TPA: hypothetical protein PLQ76_10120, partial [bacterium]|nr:hypothetical protein [bacterium]